MEPLPRASGIDSTLALLRERYEFISKRCPRLGGDVFERRLGRPAICMRGAEAARVFYEAGPLHAQAGDAAEGADAAAGSRQRRAARRAAPGIARRCCSTCLGSDGSTGCSSCSQPIRAAAHQSRARWEGVGRASTGAASQALREDAVGYE